MSWQMSHTNGRKLDNSSNQPEVVLRIVWNPQFLEIWGKPTSWKPRFLKFAENPNSRNLQKVPILESYGKSQFLKVVENPISWSLRKNPILSIFRKNPNSWTLRETPFLQICRVYEEVTVKHLESCSKILFRKA